MARLKPCKGGPRNPYPIKPGFRARVAKARKALHRLALEPSLNIYTRAFDACFEMHDGDAVVFELMETAFREDHLLARGIKLSTGAGYSVWFEIWRRGCAQRDREVTL